MSFYTPRLCARRPRVAPNLPRAFLSCCSRRDASKARKAVAENRGAEQQGLGWSSSILFRRRSGHRVAVGWNNACAGRGEAEKVGRGCREERQGGYQLDPGLGQ